MDNMKLALITTTIYVPRVLSLYRQLAKDVMFFIAGDKRTPHNEVRHFIATLDNAIYYSDTDQEKLGYKCSSIIGWNKIMRRNLALLEAIKYGADIIVTIDDDNIPITQDYFESFKSLLGSCYHGPMVNTIKNWFNVGELFNPPIYHRGFPYILRHVDLGMRLSPVCNAKVGVAAGLWLGDPDIDAMERIIKAPYIYDISDILHAGVLVDRVCFTPFNSQNTAYVKDLSPLMMVWVGVGRYDDIWAAYCAERIMMETDYHVHYGKPFVWQQRNPQNLCKNLKDELYGMEHTMSFCQDLLSMNLGGGSILEMLNRLYEYLHGKEYLPSVVHELGKAWCQDVEKVMT